LWQLRDAALEQAKTDKPRSFLTAFIQRLQTKADAEKWNVSRNGFEERPTKAVSVER